MKRIPNYRHTDRDNQRRKCKKRIRFAETTHTREGSRINLKNLHTCSSWKIMFRYFIFLSVLSPGRRISTTCTLHVQSRVSGVIAHIPSLFVIVGCNLENN